MDGFNSILYIHNWRTNTLEERFEKNKSEHSTKSQRHGQSEKELKTGIRGEGTNLHIIRFPERDNREKV